eukprot:CAMPEP_0206432852 /NCGR_PEP_ID=MMETSP0324_2-20121206/8197_1 /ASSEMBLY_ACC=CAM_ASM_000836 /TAXON_ID=2866 /ORGANISM="Crypthecodinium cohnii, Strain Seligo" /LENGTH=78 /DNA_ID=CAMNT_0053899031 /DNA_START=397 /DNA_END=630 /DNA_ORIENTATION=-
MDAACTDRWKDGSWVLWRMAGVVAPHQIGHTEWYRGVLKQTISRIAFSRASECPGREAMQMSAPDDALRAKNNRIGVR